MSKLQDLIDSLCPNGVEFKPLWSLTIWDKKFNGVDRKMQPQIISYPYVLANVFDEIEDPSGNVKLLSTGIGGAERWTTEEKAGSNLCEGEIVAIPWGGTPNVKYYKGKFVTADNRIATSNNTTKLSNKFLYHWLSNNIDIIAKTYRGAGIQHPCMLDILNILIPVPPLPVQEEIVRILDCFSSYAAELQAELQARKEQYEYYRNLLLTFNPSACGCGTDDKQKDNVIAPPSTTYKIQWKKMGEIGTFIRGNGLQKKDFTESGVGCIHYGQIYTHYGTSATKTITFVSKESSNNFRKAKPGDLVIATTSENVDDVCKCVAWLGNEEIAISSDAFIFHHDLNPKYVAYFFQTEYFQKQKLPFVTGTKVMRISSENLSKIIIPVPPIEVQEKIVAILDRFETLVNDISKGLPAEIEAQKTRYEYYRNKLLTFKPLPA